VVLFVAERTVLSVDSFRVVIVDHKD